VYPSTFAFCNVDPSARLEVSHPLANNLPSAGTDPRPRACQFNGHAAVRQVKAHPESVVDQNRTSAIAFGPKIRLESMLKLYSFGRGARGSSGSADFVQKQLLAVIAEIIQPTFPG